MLPGRSATVVRLKQTLPAVSDTLVDDFFRGETFGAASVQQVQCLGNGLL